MERPNPIQISPATALCLGNPQGLARLDSAPTGEGKTCLRRAIDLQLQDTYELTDESLRNMKMKIRPLESAMNKVEIQSPSRQAAQDLAATRHRRRSAIPVRRLHHHAMRTSNMEATRHFYEDILGMPLVATLKDEVDPSTGKVSPFVHCFFEMADGSSIAFFEFANGARGPAPKTAQDPLDHHIAIGVGSEEELKRLKYKLEEAGYPVIGQDHGFCYSLYVRDPNSTCIELTIDHPMELEINEGHAAQARRHFELWMQGDHSANDHDNGKGGYSMPSSTMEERRRAAAVNEE